MTTFRVNVNKLNLRSSPVTNFDFKENVVAVLQKDAIFESVGVLENELGRWQVNREGHTATENYLSKIDDDIPSELRKYNDKIPKIFLDFHLGKLWQLPIEEGLKVGIIDTGVDVNHHALKGKVTNLNESVPISQEKNPNHATTMACIIAGDDPEHGIIGVSSRISEIYSYTLIEGQSKPDDFINALNLLEMKNVKLINISYGEYDNSFKEDTLLQDKINSMSKNGFLIIAAVGNDSVHERTHYPAAYKNVISVAGVRSNLNRNKTSNFWEGVSVCTCSDYYFDPAIFELSNATSAATAIVTGSLANSYHLLSNQVNLFEFLDEKLSALDKINFDFLELKVSIPLFDGLSFFNILKPQS